ncbi:gamma-glutamylcyclotransferase family protein [Hydrogenophaga sp.]|uniref:gamma-glutamylcyclotransferase family protein n=1 Tax=Hydrogenophaga sp. TaxID=1904254 RepID=UPI0025C31D84|nr:gamma-glutamylcyclotransferase family protein [Hydrogenophaga sp.]
MTTTFLYFAYGSNMSAPRLRTRTPSAEPIGTAELRGFRLVFDKWGRDGSAKADCERTDAPDQVVHGGLFRIHAVDRPAMDRAEGLGQGYDACEVALKTERGAVTAWTYVATDKRPGLLPYSWYLQHVLIGAKAWRLPHRYIASIASLPTVADPDTARHAMELSIYAPR